MDGRRDGEELFANEGDHAYLHGDAFGAPDNDTPTDGDDLLRGGPGSDDTAGFGGSDGFCGGPRTDSIFAEEPSASEGEDTVHGDRGNDYIEARDGVKDAIDRGKGNTDVDFSDEGGIDIVSNDCEHKNGWPDFEGFSRAAASSDAPEKVSALRARH